MNERIFNLLIIVYLTGNYISQCIPEVRVTKNEFFSYHLKNFNIKLNFSRMRRTRNEKDMKKDQNP